MVLSIFRDFLIFAIFFFFFLPSPKNSVELQKAVVTRLTRSYKLQAIRVLLRVFIDLFPNSSFRELEPTFVALVRLHRMTHKRSNSGLDDHASQPTKIARKETDSVATDALFSANARIIELEHQIRDLHAFIIVHGLTKGK